MTDRSGESNEQETPLEELNPEGAGLGAGGDNTFEPEEDETAAAEESEDQ